MKWEAGSQDIIRQFDQVAAVCRAIQLQAKRFCVCKFEICIHVGRGAEQKEDADTLQGLVSNLQQGIGIHAPWVCLKFSAEFGSMLSGVDFSGIMQAFSSLDLDYGLE